MLLRTYVVLSYRIIVRYNYFICYSYAFIIVVLWNVAVAIPVKETPTIQYIIILRMLLHVYLAKAPSKVGTEV